MEDKVIDNYKEHRQHYGPLGFLDEKCSTCYKIKLTRNAVGETRTNDGWQQRSSFDNYQYNYFN